MSSNRILLSPREQAIQSSYEALALHLNERSARVWAASEAKRYGYGRISAVHRVSRNGSQNNTQRYPIRIIL